MRDDASRAYDTLQLYGIAGRSLHPANDDGDVFFVEGGLFLKIIRGSEGSDYLPEENLYHTYLQLALEMEIMDGLQAWDIGCARPIANASGDYVTRLGESSGDVLFATLTTRVEGVREDGRSEAAHERAYDAGVAAGKLHNASEGGVAALAVRRPHRRRLYLDALRRRLALGTDRYHSLSTDQLECLLRGVDGVEAYMSALDRDERRNVGLVHTDLRYDNFMFAPGQAIPVDFTRAVYGYHLYDLGEMCAHMGGGPVQSAILEGYKSVRRLSRQDYEAVQAFFVMFLLLLIGEQIADGESEWFVDTSSRLCRDYIPGMERGRIFDIPVP